jgi:16S rRNA A1518/A1519 N6-dimethyltransferase RsmA/KsgA/DIM1 with predicted DNA glycosylase/AP lyase activity
MHMDVLKADWPQLAADKGGCLNIIANLPYYIVSQVLFSLADSHRAVDTAVLTMQLEVFTLLAFCSYLYKVYAFDLYFYFLSMF